MKHAQRETALRARDLVVIQLHRVDGAAAELVVLRVWPEDRTQQNARLRSFRMSFGVVGATVEIVLGNNTGFKRAGRNTAGSKAAGMDFHLFSSSVSPHMPLLTS